MNKYFKQISHILSRYRFLIVFIVGAGLLLVVAWQLRSIANPSVDEEYLTRQQDQLSSRQIQIDQQLIDTINRLNDSEVNVVPDDVGTQDPFNP